MEYEDTRALNLLKTLVNVNTVNAPGNEEDLAILIKNFAEENNLYAEMKPISKGRSNIIVKLKGINSDLPSLVFSGHLDTVPIGEEKYWDMDPFSGVVKEGKLYGRGSCDMKGGVAAFLESMVTLKELGFESNMDIVFVGTVGEEVDCIGSKTIVHDEIFENVGAMIIAEPSNNKIFTAHKGAYWLKFNLYGQTAHGSMPAEGKNAILAAQTLTSSIYNLEFLTSVKNELLGFPSANISMIDGGVNTNVVPDFCSLTVDFRTVPGINHSTIHDKLTLALNEMKNKKEIIDWDIEILHDLPPLSNKKGDDFIELAFDIRNKNSIIQENELGVNYYTDGSIYGQKFDIPILIIGPGDEKLAHQPNEYVEIEKYYEAIETYINIATAYSHNK